MKTTKLRLFEISVFFLLFGRSSGLVDVRLTIDNKTINPLDILIPTVFSDNVQCRNHSLLYQEELSKFTVWATDMFDASSKFPSGVFIGSLYDTGNFDECINVHLPENIGFSGQHCMAHFKLSPLSPILLQNRIVSGYDQYENIFNVTTWKKIAQYAQDDTKQKRDEFFYSFCIPSSCSYQDLEKSLKRNILILKNALPFNLKVDVNPRNCQVETNLTLTTWRETLFVSILGGFICITTLCTIYHLMTKLEGLEGLKLSGKTHEILKAFSISHSIKKLATESKSEDGLDGINGLKVAAMCLIIMGHRIMFHMSSPLSNPAFMEGAYKESITMLLLNGPMIVDTFFTISGFLACFLLLKEMDKRQGMINVPMLYLYRFLRLTPAYAIVVGFYCTMLIQLGEGPLWTERVSVEQERCLESWWANILYINNYVNLDSICMFQSWYLTCDTHYFLVVPFLAYLLWKKPKLGIVLVGILTILSVIVPFVTLLITKEDPFLLLYFKLLRDPTTHNTFKNIYIPSHMRASSYLIGISAGYLKYKIKDTGLKISKKSAYLGWVLCFSSVGILFQLGFSFYGLSDSKDYLFSGLYGSLHHLVWSLCISWGILAVSEGYGNWLEPVFSWRPLILLGRITYSAFLCHGAIQIYSTAIVRAPLPSNVFLLASYTASDVCLAYIVGFALTLVFEAPIVSVAKILFRQATDKSHQEDTKKNHKFNNNGLRDIYIPKIMELHKNELRNGLSPTVPRS